MICHSHACICCVCAGSINGEQDGQLAIITRSNWQLFQEAVKKCCFEDTTQRVAFVGVSNVIITLFAHVKNNGA